MPFYKNFIFCTYLMIFIGAVSLAMSEGSPFYIAITFFFLSLAWYRSRTGRTEVLSKSLAYRLSLLTFLFLGFDWLVISQALPLAFAHFLLLIQIIKVYSVKQDRDYIQIYSISFIHLALSSIMTIDLSFGLSFILYMIAASWALTLFHLKRGVEHFLWKQKSDDDNNSISDRKRWQAVGASRDQLNFAARSFYAASCASALLTLIFTIFLFSIFPRIGTSFIRLKYRGHTDTVSGFSDHVSFGQIGKIKMDTSPVLTLKFLTPPTSNPELYIRGLSYNHYDGQQWTSKSLPGSKLKNSINCPIDNFGYRIPDHERLYRYPDAGQFTYRIAQEIVQSQAVFHMGPATAISYTGEKPDRLYFNPIDETIHMSHMPKGELRYVAKTMDIPFTPEALRLRPARIANLELQDLFTGFEGGNEQQRQQIHDFAISTFEQADAETDYDRARALESRLQSEFSYTLTQDPTPNVEPVYDFLFNIKKGHCEYFASAMVILCRTAGIPSRLVGGYRGGDLNDMGEFYQITQANAHAWVEVYFSGFGWIRFDPTPADSLPQESLLRNFRKWVDYLRYSWDEFVIDFSIKEQLVILSVLKQKMEEIRQSLEEIPNILFRVVAFLKMLFQNYSLYLLVTLPLWIYLISKLKRYLSVLQFGKLLQSQAKSTQMLIDFYIEFLMALEHHGFTKQDDETAREFANRVIGTGGVAFTPIHTVVMKYYDTRYGLIALTADDLLLIQDILTEMRSITPDLKDKRRGLLA